MPFEFLGSEFVADAILARLREGSFPNGEQARFLDRSPLIDLLRQRILPADIAGLLDRVNAAEDRSAGLACSLLRKQLIDQRVKAGFEARWHTASPYLQNRLMWRLLDDPELDRAWHVRFRDFVFKEWDIFQEFNLDFYGTPKKAVGSLLSRMTDRSFPDSKKWIYVCSAPGAIQDRDQARAIVSLGFLLPDSFAKEVSREILERFFSPNSDWKVPSVEANDSENQAGMDYVAKAVFASLRKGILPPASDADFLNRLPIIEFLRMQPEEADLEWLTGMLDTMHGEVAGLCLSLFKRFTKREDVQRQLRERWKGGDAFLRAHLLWRFLDDPALSTTWHETIFQFIMAEWATFREVSLKFLGTPQTVVEQMLERVGDPGYTESKKWVCLCRVAEVAANPAAARALLHLGRSLRDPFARHVADELLKRFYPEFCS